MEKIINIGTCSPQEIFTLTVVMFFIILDLAKQKVDFFALFVLLSNHFNQ